jgi:hypothetical protein
MILKVLKNILKVKNIEYINKKSKLESIAILPSNSVDLYSILVQLGLVIADQQKLKSWLDKLGKKSIVPANYFVLHKGSHAIFINSLRESLNLIQIYEIPLTAISNLLKTKGLKLTDYLVYLPLTGHIRLVESNPNNINFMYDALVSLSTNKNPNIIVLCDTQFNLSLSKDDDGKPQTLVATLDILQFGSRKIRA